MELPPVHLGASSLPRGGAALSCLCSSVKFSPGPAAVQLLVEKQSPSSRSPAPQPPGLWSRGPPCVSPFPEPFAHLRVPLPQSWPEVGLSSTRSWVSAAPEAELPRVGAVGSCWPGLGGGSGSSQEVGVGFWTHGLKCLRVLLPETWP